MDPVFTIPWDIWIKVFEYLSITDLIQCALTYKYWNKLIISLNMIRKHFTQYLETFDWIDSNLIKLLNKHNLCGQDFKENETNLINLYQCFNLLKNDNYTLKRNDLTDYNIINGNGNNHIYN